MQAQATRTEVQSITATQSLAAVQTMLRAGLGCITYLRDLLPEENFTQSHLVADEDSSLSYQGSDSSFSSATSKQSRSTNGFKITTMTRGYSDEADKILNYLENGIFDALQKQYLQSFIFAIYLDNEDPNNIVEAYTFNFQYHALPGTDYVVPIMTLGDGLEKMSLKDKKDHSDDPVTKAAKSGKAPTLLDVKKSVKALLKTLIHATTQMDVLPKRRFATFKLFYTDKAPASYEPPHFQAGDSEKDKWFFMTHDLDEVPDKWSIGKVNTGHHSVNLSVTSIATYLPSSTQHNNVAFLGTTSRLPVAPTLTPIQEASFRAEQAAKQARDANERNVAWSVEEAIELTDLDAEGEDDPDYHDPVRKFDVQKPSLGVLAPLGLRNESGQIEPLVLPMDVDETYFGGVSEAVPTRLNDLNMSRATETSNIEQTQVIGGFTQTVSQPRHMSPSSSFTADILFSPKNPEGTWAPPGASPITSPLFATSHGGGIGMHVLKDGPTTLEEETLDLETQMESIESYGLVSAETIKGFDTPTPIIHKRKSDTIDNGLNCDCGIPTEDELCFCEAGCGRWYHVWCMGYHSIKDPRLPSEFVCFDCRVRADSSWELIKVNLYPIMLSRFEDLALFRRAIKIAEKKKAGTPADLAKAYGGNNVLARQLFKRLETEGFVVEQSTTLDDLGFSETYPKNKKGDRKTKGRQTKNRKNVQKAKYIFNHSALLTVEYSNYFNPNPKVESHILGLSELTSRFKIRAKAPNSPITLTDHIPLVPSELPDETQTQDETQMLPNDDFGPKRTSTRSDAKQTPRPRKKVKISVTYALDLAE